MKYSELTDTRMQQFTSTATEGRLNQARQNIRKFIEDTRKTMIEIRKRMEKVKRDGRTWKKWLEKLEASSEEWSYATWAFDEVSNELMTRCAHDGKMRNDLFKDTREFLIWAAN